LDADSGRNTLDPGNGRGNIGTGSGAALTGGAKTGDTTATVGGTNGNSAGTNPAGANGPSGTNPAGTGTNNSGNGTIPPGPGTGAGSATAGTGTGPGNAPGPGLVVRPATGYFDAVVVQSSPTDQYPESRGLLSGRPIYSVYLPLGTARDWTLFYCVPGEKPDPGNGAVISLGTAGPQLKAPYPTKLVKPAIALPSWQKYVLVHGVVNKEGRFENLRVVRSIKPETDQALLLSLGNWEFRAATREGAAIAVEFLLSIPARGL